MSAIFGPAGNAESFPYKSSVDAPRWLAELGLDCYEYQCGKGVNVGEATARKVGEAARAAEISLSLHAPYFINLANPDPEIMPDAALAAGAAVAATGRSDFPNQINNLLAFPGIFKGALEVRARDISEGMLLAAVDAIAGLIAPGDRSACNIIPDPFDSRVVPAVAAAVAERAREEGLARA